MQTTKLSFKRAVKRAVIEHNENEIGDKKEALHIRMETETEFDQGPSDVFGIRNASLLSSPQDKMRDHPDVQKAMNLIKKKRNNCKHQETIEITRAEMDSIMEGFVRLVSSGGVEYTGLKSSFASNTTIFDRNMKSFITQMYSDKTDEEELVDQFRRSSLTRRCLSAFSPQLENGKRLMDSLTIIMDLNAADSEKLKSEMSKLSTWKFNVFAVEKIIPGAALLVVGCGVLETHHLVSHFRIGFEKIRNFLMAVSQKYFANAYHNALHAADVTQAMHHFLTLGGLGSSLDPTTKFAALFAAVIHDISHPARTNSYLIARNDEMAVRYGYRSPLERMHCAIAFSLLVIPANDILENMMSVDVLKFRRVVVDMVLSTDNAYHSKYMARFDKRLQSGLDLKSEDDQIITLQIALHAADVSNAAKPLEIYCEWTRRIMEEFYDQGDEEIQQSMNISIGFNRNEPIPEPKMQAGFIIGIVKPVYLALSNTPKVSLDQCLRQLDENLAHWTKKMNTNKSQQISLRPPPPPE